MLSKDRILIAPPGVSKDAAILYLNMDATQQTSVNGSVMIFAL